MQERYFPVGIQTFEEIRRLNAIYIDKTDLVHRLATTGKYYFLSRPRRFGKSLLVSTLKAYFEGRKDLFEGLTIEKLEQNWVKYPVLSFSLSLNRVIGPDSIDNLLDYMLSDYERIYGGGEADKTEYGLRLARVIERAKSQTGQNVVVLIDEYDAPLLDTMHNKALFDLVRQKLRNFFSPLKDMDKNLQFVFITGITKYSQLSIFSELNNLTTITMTDEFAAICGITKEEIVEQLGQEVENLANALEISKNAALQRLKRKYDGYHFTKKSPDIYNPFSLLKCLKEKELNSYWFASGTPTALTEMIGNYTLRPEELDGFLASEMDFDVPIELAETPIPMLYQSGYVTIKSFKRGLYILGFPNDEVRVGFIKGLVPFYTNKTASQNNSFIIKLINALNNGEVDSAMTLLRSFFSSIPYNAEKQDENHYKTIFYLIFTLVTEFSVRTEECSAAGRCDALIETDDTIYLFEFKLDGTAEEALKQIDDKGYAIQYEAGDKKIVKIGANFEKERRTIERWVVA